MYIYIYIYTHTHTHTHLHTLGQEESGRTRRGERGDALQNPPTPAETPPLQDALTATLPSQSDEPALHDAQAEALCLWEQEPGAVVVSVLIVVRECVSMSKVICRCMVCGTASRHLSLLFSAGVAAVVLILFESMHACMHVYMYVGRWVGR